MPTIKQEKAAIKKTLREAMNDPAAQEAIKKEKQPVTPGDLSAIHNTIEIGTSGGDQRASENEINQDNINHDDNAPAKKEIRPQK